jgi:hypothetical protein
VRKGAQPGKEDRNWRRGKNKSVGDVAFVGMMVKQLLLIVQLLHSVSSGRADSRRQPTLVPAPHNRISGCVGAVAEVRFDLGTFWNKDLISV